MLDLETMILNCHEVVAFQHFQEEGERERDVRANAIGRFQDALADTCDVVPSALRFATISDDKVAFPDSDEARNVQRLARKLRELTETFEEAADRTQRAREQQKKRRLASNRRTYAGSRFATTITTMCKRRYRALSGSSRANLT